MSVTYLQAFLVLTLPVMGLIYALLGGLKLPLAERLGLDEGRVGRLVGGFGLMVGPTIMLCGFLTDALGRKGVFMAGMVLISLALMILARGTTYRAALVAVFLLGAGWSGTINVGNVLMRISVDSDRLTQALNFYDFVFGFGAFVTPFVLGLLLKRLGFGGGLGLLALLALLPVALGALAPMDPPAPAAAAAAAPDAGLKTLFASRVFWLAGLAFLFYVPIESSVAGWATTLVTRQGPGGERAASLALSGFWLAFMGSRLLVSIVGLHGHEHAALQALSIAAVGLAAALVMLRGRGAVATAVVLAGAICGPVFPTLIGVFLGGVPEAVLGRAVGFFFAFASVGWTVIPSLIGAVARRSGNIQRGFGVAAVSGALFAALIALLQLLT
ncbi:MAG TPA: MFS transporter [Planctomycetota bacterium]|nr:MFS transporter [Planctomycetota bacterium]